jgi:hypothetical protein
MNQKVLLFFIPHPSSLNIMSWQLRVSHLVLPKDGAAEAECEDAVGVNAAAARFAVADGATEAFDASSWARRLAEVWVATEPPVLTGAAFGAWVAEQGAALHATWEGRQLSWYAEEKMRRGSFAAFVGVQFEFAAAVARWTCVALGDSCLIQRRGALVSVALPLDDPARFTTSPVLVPSRGELHENALAQTRIEQGTCEQGDVLWLLSDAAAEWFLRRAAARDAALDELDELLASDRAGAAVALFQRERRARRIKDDDVAIVRVQLLAR